MRSCSSDRSPGGDSDTGPKKFTYFMAVVEHACSRPESCHLPAFLSRRSGGGGGGGRVLGLLDNSAISAGWERRGS